MCFYCVYVCVCVSPCAETPSISSFVYAENKELLVVFFFFFFISSFTSVHFYQLILKIVWSMEFGITFQTILGAVYISLLVFCLIYFLLQTKRNLFIRTTIEI